MIDAQQVTRSQGNVKFDPLEPNLVRNWLTSDNEDEVVRTGRRVGLRTRRHWTQQSESKTLFARIKR